jgi:hypothetical protein
MTTDYRDRIRHDPCGRGQAPDVERDRRINYRALPFRPRPGIRSRHCRSRDRGHGQRDRRDTRGACVVHGQQHARSPTLGGMRLVETRGGATILLLFRVLSVDVSGFTDFLQPCIGLQLDRVAEPSGLVLQ